MAKTKKYKTPPPLIQRADKVRARIQNAFYDMVVNARKTIDMKAVDEALNSNNLVLAMNAMDLQNKLLDASKGAGVSVKGHSFLDALKAGFQNGAEAALEALDKVPVRKADPSIGMSMAFDVTNPETLTWLNSYNLALITGVSSDSREAIRGIITNAFQQGGHPYVQAREIRDYIGLTPQQAQAVRNYRAALDSSDPGTLRSALNRALRDRRFDPSVENEIRSALEEDREPSLSQDRKDSMVQRYADRMLNYRAETIARTESIRAAVKGTQSVWNEATNQGYLNENTRQVWIANPEACPICEQVPDDNDGGVPLGGSFDTDLGPSDGPPLHPNCRCSIALEFPEEGEED